MPAKHNLVGQVFGRLTVIAEGPRNSRGHVQWRCLCACGKPFITRAHYLRRGDTRSCGCAKSDRMREEGRKRWTTHGATGSPEFMSWSSMRMRCYNKRSKSYKWYGGRGIKVCDEWQGKDGFANFLAHMGKRPSTKHSLDRINPNGNYEPGNCRWANSKQQIANRRRLRAIVVRVTLPFVRSWAKGA